MLHNKTIHDLLDIQTIYLKPEVRNYTRGQEILQRYGNAKIIEVPSTGKYRNCMVLPVQQMTELILSGTY